MLKNLAMLVFGPPMVYLTIRHKPPEVTQIEGKDLPSRSIEDWLKKEVEWFEREGFTFHGYWVVHLRRITAYRAVLDIAESGITANAESIVSPAHPIGIPAKEVRRLFMATRDLNHRLLITSNYDGSDVSRNDPDVMRWVAPWLTDRAKLLRAHTLLLKHSDLGLPRQSLSADVAKTICENLEREHLRLVRKGELKRFGENGFRPTLWGALAMSWWIAFKSIRTTRAQSRTRARLRELGAEDLAQ